MDQEKKKEEQKIFSSQDDQYVFPYHHIPYINNDMTISRTRILNWGFDYLACKYHAIKTIESFSPRSVLEVGCGDGAIIGAVSRKISRRVGVDLSTRAIAFAKAFYNDIEFYADDVKNIDEKFDCIMLIEVLEHIPDDQLTPFLNVIESKLTGKGKIYISVPSINLPLYKKHYRHYTPELLEKQITDARINVNIDCCRYFRSPSKLENIYKRLTCNRFFVGEINFIKNYIWRKSLININRCHSKTAQHVIMILSK